jgi:hypothetical protein
MLRLSPSLEYEPMSVTISDKTTNPLLVTGDQSLAAYRGVTVADTNLLSDTETVSITLSQALNPPLGPNYDFYPTVTNLGSISDPSGGGTWNAATETFTESGVIGGDPNFATNLLSRLQYSAPQLPNGQGFATQASITVTDGGVAATDATPVIVGVLTPPAVAGTVANEPIASGSSISPFAILNVANPSFSYDYYTIVAGSPNNTYVFGLNYYYIPKDTATTITVTDDGQATDADGLLTGPGLSKTGVGTYSLTSQQYYNIGYALQDLKFTTNTLPAGQTENPTFEVDVTDATLNLTTKDTTTSLLIIGPASGPPNIAGTQAGQTVAPGNVLDPFASVTVSDTNQKPMDSATITLTDASGKATDANGTLTGTGLTETAAGSGIYTLVATDPTTLTSELDALTFHPTALPSGVIFATTGFSLTVIDQASSPATSTDKKTTVTEKAPPSSGPPVIFGTVGGQSATQGTTVQPFAGVRIIDNAPNATDTAFIDLGSTTFGTLTLPNDPSALTASLSGERYTLSATDPADLTKEIDALVFTPTSQILAGPARATLALSVTDIKNNESATDKTTTMTETPAPPPPPQPPLPPGVVVGPPNYFAVRDQTTGGSWLATGSAYNGPVAGLTNEIIVATSDNINITAKVANVFISTDGGTGEDAIAVNGVNGNNVLNGSNGSSFLYGGTGDDTFFVDDRIATTNIWSTIVNFHSGDNATIWGLTATDFTLSWINGQGAVGFTGLTLDATAAGKPIAAATLSGYTMADLTDGKLSISFGTTANLPGLPGSNYMQIHAN